ncbi:hypothetical protein AK812_SmicGene35260 [Symbiodinium microadriaticum]|uniref:Uncharacterized protein n=1 Tax=Symbiodinium microadriaticum TaxID=2951 RepID=A0A1Q9CLY2_SYMMI|nr:hypothetical protein AK812_SmicGene35260 [Symbiodinium microadriaticum]
MASHALRTFAASALLCLSAASWPPENPCSGLAPEDCIGVCEMDCNSSGRTLWSDVCWPARGNAQGFTCDYYGGRYFCGSGPWLCQSGFGLGSGNGCHCWSGYHGYSKCCPCPDVENCAGREHINCSGTRKAWGAGSLAHLQVAGGRAVPPDVRDQPGNGCHCWSGYHGYSKCCPCPDVENCAGREHINCSGTRKAWGAGSLAHLQAPRCSLCKTGFVRAHDGTACLPE